MNDKFIKNAEFFWKIMKKLLPKFATDRIHSRLRAKKWPASIFGPKYRTNHLRIELNITFDCNLKCLNCNRSCSQAPSKDHMTIGQVEKFIEESRKKKRAWEKIRVMGGEPAMHPQISEILRMLMSYKKECGNETKIVFVTNGFGEESKDVLTSIPRGISVENSNKKSVIQKDFYSFNAAPADFKEFHNADYSNKCMAATFCGLGLNKYGYYICSNASGIDRVFGFDLGRKELPDPDDQMAGQALELCKYCGRFKTGKDDNNLEISPSWKESYEKYKQAKPVLREY